MKKFKFSILMILIMICLSGCSISETSIDDRLNAPKNTVAPLEGKWTVTDFTPISASNSKEEKEYMGQPALFHKDALIFMSYYTVKPSFKMKKVNAVDYLLYKYKLNASSLGIETLKVKVYTVYDDNQLFMEAIEDENGNLFLYIEDGFYSLEKTIDTVSLEEIYKYIDIEKIVVKDLEEKDNNQTDSGILLGIKSSEFDEKNNITNWTYNTIWINTENRKLKELYEIDGILLPRKNGFWEIDVSRNEENDQIYDTIDANPIIYDEDIKNENIFYDEDTPTRSKQIIAYDNTFLKNILYIGNNYISTENIAIKNNNKRTIKIQTLDNLKLNNSLKIEDIIDDGKEIFLEGVQGLLNIDKSILIDEENIGITRKNGYWMLKGRVNFEKNEEELYKDFIIKTVPPEEMVGHDKHFILWDEMRRKYPNIIDMYSSPNEDIIIVRDKEKLLVFNTDDNSTSVNYNPIAKIDFSEADSIIMAEWATGKYTEMWSKEIQKKDFKKIEQ